MQEIIVERDNGKDFKFTGELLAETYTALGLGYIERYSLFKTKGGKFVCLKTETEKNYRIMFLGYTTSINRTAAAVDTEDGVIDFFGPTIGQRLLKDTNAGTYEEID